MIASLLKFLVRKLIIFLLKLFFFWQIRNIIWWVVYLMILMYLHIPRKRSTCWSLGVRQKKTKDKLETSWRQIVLNLIRKSLMECMKQLFCYKMSKPMIWRLSKSKMLHLINPHIFLLKNGKPIKTKNLQKNLRNLDYIQLSL